MMRYVAIVVLIFTLTSCTTQKSTTSTKDYWTKAPDLSKVTYEGGDGKTIESPIVIKNAENERDGIASEYAFIAKAHGEKFKDWKPLGQSTNTKEGPKIDSIKIQLIGKEETLTYYFDITDFYGKF